ncbi:MAG: UDP-N-acetylmuramoyl-tripeptide--D-alanyl-D-alanine ligase [Ignavibacterium sp.]
MKKIQITLEDLFNLPSSEIFNPDDYINVTSVSIDSRNIKKNSLFVAIKGDKFDGHNFAKDAIENGASAILIEKSKLGQYDDVAVPIIVVDDTIKALGDLAKLWRKKFNGKVIGLTGSNGKTTTKEIIYTLLNEKYKVIRTMGNNNNQIGVPLTIFSVSNDDDYLIIEIGTNHFGEVRYSSEIAQPDYALITNIGPSHLEFLKNLNGVKKEKIALFEITDKNKGLIFLNADDKLLHSLKNKYKKVISYSLNSSSKNEEIDVKGEILEFDKNGKAKIKFYYNRKSFEIISPILGEHNARNILAAVAIGLQLGLSFEEIKKGIEKLKAVKQRFDVKRLNDILLIDDTYNANPLSMRSAINYIGKLNHYENKIAILGDMFELGEKEIELHKNLSSSIIKNKVNVLLTVGNLMKYLSKEINDKNIFKKHFPNKEDLKNFLMDYDFNNSAILVKGSRGMQMEEIVSTIELKVKH